MTAKAARNAGRTYFLLPNNMDNHYQTRPDYPYSEAQTHALYEACQSVVEHRDCLCETGMPKCSVCQCREAIAFIHYELDEEPLLEAESQSITRDQFMAFFRSGTFHEQMSDDDCREVFATVLKGGSDITAESLNDLLEDYSVEDVIVVNTKTLDWK